MDQAVCTASSASWSSPEMYAQTRHISSWYAGDDAPEGELVPCGSGLDDPDEVLVSDLRHCPHTHQIRGVGQV